MIVLAKKGGYTSTGHHKYPALYWPHDLPLQPGGGLHERKLRRSAFPDMAQSWAL
ncbi:MAG: hypothetical protein AAFR90_00525 [Pseudomonadota bacterium]